MYIPAWKLKHSVVHYDIISSKTWKKERPHGLPKPYTQIRTIHFEACYEF